MNREVSGQSLLMRTVRDARDAAKASKRAPKMSWLSRNKGPAAGVVGAGATVGLLAILRNYIQSKQED